MATLQGAISERFLERLSDAKEFDADKVNQLRALLSKGIKPKPEDLVGVFSLPPGDIK